MPNDRHRYVEWRDKSGQVVARELYDHVLDPQENQNVADKPEHAKLLGELGAQLRAGIKLRADWQPNRRAAYMTPQQLASGYYRMEIDN